MSDLDPRLILIAGPNGAGKTEFTTNALAHEWLEGFEYINADLIAQREFGDWNSPSAIAKAARWATERRYQCLSESKSLAVETVFSSAEKLEFVDTALRAGFFIRLFFVGRGSPTIKASRIAQRVMQGGHEVPTQKIIERYWKSILNLTKVLPVVNKGYIYDNSVEGELPNLQFRTVEGSVHKVYATDHEWSNQVLEPLRAR